MMRERGKKDENREKRKKGTDGRKIERERERCNKRKREKENRR